MYVCVYIVYVLLFTAATLNTFVLYLNLCCLGSCSDFRLIDLRITVHSGHCSTNILELLGGDIFHVERKRQSICD